MPRAPRLEFPGAYYHIMNRGDHLEAVFTDDRDRAIFLTTLAETCESAGWRVHSFVLMGNHYHLLIDTPRPTLVKGMQYLNSTYTQRYNSRHKTHGHLFQGRYKALVVDQKGPGYFLTVSDYIHLNPVRAKRVQTADALWRDPWNSVGWLAGKRAKRPPWLVWDRVYQALGLGSWTAVSQQAFRLHVRTRMGEDEPETWQTLRRGWGLGSEGFLEDMRTRLAAMRESGPEADSWSGAAAEEAEQGRAQRLLVQAARRLGYARLEEVEGQDRYLLAKWVRTQTQVSVPWLAERLGVRTRGGMSNGIYLVGQALPKDPRLQHRWRKVGM